MNVFLDKAQRMWIIILAAMVGIIITYYLVKPYVLEPLGFINTNRCLKIFYKTNGNTALVYVEPINVWFWYVDKKIYVYGDTPDRYCTNPSEYTPVYVLDAEQQGKGMGYKCVQKLDTVKKYYDSIEDYNIVFHCLNPGDKLLTVQQIFNILLQKRIVFN